MISLSKLLEERSKRNFEIYGREVHFRDSFKIKTFYLNGKEFTFNATLVTWAEGDTRYGLLLDPIVKQVTKNYGWPIPSEEILVEDKDAMQNELFRIFREHDAGKQQDLRNMQTRTGDSD